MTLRKQEQKDRIKFQKLFAEHLKKIRKIKGFTSAKLAKECNMERSNIARLEGGRTNPSLFVLKKLAEGMGIELSELLKGL